MKDYTYVKPGLAAFVDVDKPVIRKLTDAIVYSQLKQEQDKRASKKVLQFGNTFLRCFLI